MWTGAASFRMRTDTSAVNANQAFATRERIGDLLIGGLDSDVTLASARNSGGIGGTPSATRFSGMSAARTQLAAASAKRKRRMTFVVVIRKMPARPACANYERPAASHVKTRQHSPKPFLRHKCQTDLPPVTFMTGGSIPLRTSTRTGFPRSESEWSYPGCHLGALLVTVAIYLPVMWIENLS